MDVPANWLRPTLAAAPADHSDLILPRTALTVDQRPSEVVDDTIDIRWEDVSFVLAEITHRSWDSLKKQYSHNWPVKCLLMRLPDIATAESWFLDDLFAKGLLIALGLRKNLLLFCGGVGVGQLCTMAALPSAPLRGLLGLVLGSLVGDGHSLAPPSWRLCNVRYVKWRQVRNRFLFWSGLKTYYLSNRSNIHLHESGEVSVGFQLGSWVTLHHSLGFAVQSYLRAS